MRYGRYILEMVNTDKGWQIYIYCGWYIVIRDGRYKLWMVYSE